MLAQDELPRSKPDLSPKTHCKSYILYPSADHKISKAKPITEDRYSTCSGDKRLSGESSLLNLLKTGKSPVRSNFVG